MVDMVVPFKYVSDLNGFIAMQSNGEYKVIPASTNKLWKKCQSILGEFKL